MASAQPKKYVSRGKDRAPKRKGCDKVKHFLYDKDAGTYCSRTIIQWLQLIVCYLIFYSCLCLFWYSMYSSYQEMLDVSKPTWQTTKSLIGNQPGVGVRPSQTKANRHNTLFYLDQHFDGTSLGDSEEDSSRGYATRANEFFKDYEENLNNPNASKDCVGDKPNQAEKGKFCKFDLSTLGECEHFPYGYNTIRGRISPCIYIKLNRIYGLVPEAITKEDELPGDTDEEFREYIKKQGFPDNKVFIDCSGQFPADKVALAGKLSYFPADRSISLRYFPAESIHDNENAMVAVKLKELPVGQLVHVICKAYYKGVEHHVKEKEGLVTFQFLVHD